ncbi:MAG TPA: NTP transferase domain-containing protein, partial [Ilumatobacter sp.]|nr:NTP transferase domain-containing protein [Ilumatobacter sp.]
MTIDPPTPDPPTPDPPTDGYDAIVVAGGSGSRLGGTVPGHKAQIRLAGRLLVDHVLAAVGDAATVVCVASGLPERLLGDPLRCVEQPVGAGPLAAVAAGLELVTSERVALVAADTPFIGGALTSLRRELEARDADAA